MPTSPSPSIVGIAGPSCSGKSSLSREITRLARVPSFVLSQDLFYQDLSDVPPPERELRNFDHPDALDWDLFRQVVTDLSRGKPASIPVYSFTEHRRLETVNTLEPTPLLIVEGLYALHDPAVRALMHVKVYVDVAEDLALKRRLARDLRERGRTEASIRRQFEECVRPMWRSEVEQSRQWADLILDGAQDLNLAALHLIQHIDPGPQP